MDDSGSRGRTRVGRVESMRDTRIDFLLSRIALLFSRLLALEDRTLSLERPAVEKMILAYMKAHPGSTLHQILEPFRKTELWLAAYHVVYGGDGLLKQTMIVEEKHGRGHPHTYTVKEV